MDEMLWSFSRLNSFYNCQYEWKKVYLEGDRGENGFFGEFGGFCHKILEKCEKNELSIWDAPDYYCEHFGEEVVHEAPPNKFTDIRQAYYDKGLEYFETFDLELEKYEILGVERQVDFEVKGHPFIGYIDLLLKDKETGAIIILDHKSGTLKLLKNGNVSKSEHEHYMEFKRQLYLYSIPIIQEYGKVDYLRWNLFKQGDILTIPWKEEEYREAISWATETIKMIEAEKNWYPNPDQFYCNYLCSQRTNSCPYKP